jgi:lipopolysaccharide/colanic/teichoic acid biosynthesis glycosyltransferase
VQQTSPPNLERRHSRWYEAYLLSEASQLIVGAILVCAVPGLLLWGGEFWKGWGSPQITALVAVEASFVLSAIALRRLGSFPGTSYVANVFPVVVLVFLLVFAFILFTRLEYSRPLLLLGAVVALAWCLLCALAAKGFLRMKVAALPVGRSLHVQSNAQVEVRVLARPDTEGVRFDAVVADLGENSLGSDWERFLANCALARVPVYHVRRLEEAVTGRVGVDSLSANEAGNLLPSPLYAACKRLIDVLGVLLVLPIALPLMVLTALAIRLDSAGPAIFIQERVGLGNKTFSIYKFRSMVADAASMGAEETQDDDQRITRVGHFIRLIRVDELPQLLNVLKGDMSLIGPRPEMREMIDRFCKQIPFYAYRHVVRPGITGWAQVMQGATNNIDGARLKIQYDLYYIKHFSLWLDALIVLKTIKVVLTGRGAR